MIVYSKGGLGLLCTMLQMKGSVMPRCIHVSTLSAVVAVLLLLYKRGYWIVSTPRSDWLDHPFGAAAFSTLLGLCIVFRTNMALDRYQEGQAHVQQMFLKWTDTFSQLSAFTVVSNNNAGANPRVLNEWLMKMAHWFSLMSAFAVRELRRLSDPGRENHRVRPIIISDYAKLHKLPRVEDDKRRESGAKINYLEGIPIKEEDNWKRLRTSVFNRDIQAFSIRDTLQQNTLSRWYDQCMRSKNWPYPISSSKDAHMSYLLPLNADEIEALDQSSDKVLMLSMWIQENILRKMNEQLLLVPGPIVSRCYQELSKGMMGYNSAMKIALVPFPFPFAQMVTTLLIAFALMVPILIVNFTDSLVLSPILSFVTVLGYWGLNEIATELEEPFGDDLNDLPLVQMHDELMTNIEDALLEYPMRFKMQPLVSFTPLD